MTFILKDIITGGKNKFISFPVIYKILNNPVIIAILLTVIMLLITMIVYDETAGCKNLFKTSFYIFLFNFGILLFYNHVIDKNWEDKNCSQVERSLLNSTSEITGGIEYEGFERTSLDDLPEETDLQLIIPADAEPIPDMLIN